MRKRPYFLQGVFARLSERSACVDPWRYLGAFRDDVGSAGDTAPMSPPATFAQAGDRDLDLAVRATAETVWRICSAPIVRQNELRTGRGPATMPWPRWRTADASSRLQAVDRTAPRWRRMCFPRAPERRPEWDAIALLREYEAAGKNGAALERARERLRLWTTRRSHGLARVR
jgi:hypothetical protein